MARVACQTGKKARRDSPRTLIGTPGVPYGGGSVDLSGAPVLVPRLARVACQTGKKARPRQPSNANWHARRAIRRRKRRFEPGASVSFAVWHVCRAETVGVRSRGFTRPDPVFLVRPMIQVEKELWHGTSKRPVFRWMECPTLQTEEESRPGARRPALVRRLDHPAIQECKGVARGLRAAARGTWRAGYVPPRGVRGARATCRRAGYVPPRGLRAAARATCRRAGYLPRRDVSAERPPLRDDALDVTAPTVVAARSAARPQGSAGTSREPGPGSRPVGTAFRIGSARGSRPGRA